MKRLFNITICRYICLIMLSVGWLSCDDSINDWDVDESTKGLFRPLTFEKVVNDATTVTLRYSKIVNANKYIFEFYKGELEFKEENYVRTDTILADTLTIFANSSTPMRVEYRTIFKKLDGSTQYSVRMKGLSDSGLTSRYLDLAFMTTAEQLFENIETTINSVILSWKETPDVTHLLLFPLKDASKGTYGDPETIELTAEDIENHSKIISDLPSGTSYKVQICKNDVVRGEYMFKTLGLGDGEVISVPASKDENDLIDLTSLMKNVTASNLTLEFEAGKLYNIGSVKIPAVDNILFTSSSTDEENKPRILVKEISLTSPLESMSFEYVSLDGRNETVYLMALGSVCFNSISFEGCTIRNMQRSVIRLTKAGFFISNITFNNSVLSRIGTNGYGLLVVNQDPSALDQVMISNCTLIDMGEQLMELRGAACRNQVLLENCTIYSGADATRDLNRLFRFNSDPQSVEIRNNIFAGPNKNKTITPGYSDYKYLNFSNNNYITSDMKIGNKKFSEIVQLEQTSDDIFVDPANGDFHIKPGAGFAGEGNAGDPRWWKK